MQHSYVVQWRTDGQPRETPPTRDLDFVHDCLEMLRQRAATGEPITHIDYVIRERPKK